LETTQGAIREYGREEVRLSAVTRPGPNPTGGAVRLAGLRIERATVRIYDVAGKEVMSMKLYSPGGAPEIDLSSLPSGLYFLDVRSGNKGYSGKVIKR
jgi:hypothetical protein